MKNWKRIPTYEECVEMCKIHGDMIFYMTEKFIQGYKFHIFSYRYAQPKEFLNPIPGNDVTAHDLRGLTFVFNKDGSLFKRFVGLPKFWNVNQCIESLYEDFKDEPIKSIYDKRDGTMVTFIKLPDGTILPKTKGSIYGDEAGYEYFERVKYIYDMDDELQRFVTDCLDFDLVPIFEYTSYDNKIVLRYDKEELVLLRVRDNVTGKFVPLDNITDEYNVKLAYRFSGLTLEDLMKKAENTIEAEGWVIEFEDGTLLKQKTKWYFERHNITTDEITRSNAIATMILNDTIDDAITLLDPIQDKQRIDNINDIQEKLVDYMSKEYERIMTVYATIYVGLYKSDKKAYALGTTKKDRTFSMVMGIANGKDLKELIKEFVKKEAYYFAKMENFLETGEF